MGAERCKIELAVYSNRCRESFRMLYLWWRCNWLLRV